MLTDYVSLVTIPTCGLMKRQPKLHRRHLNQSAAVRAPRQTFHYASGPVMNFSHQLNGIRTRTGFLPVQANICIRLAMDLAIVKLILMVRRPSIVSTNIVRGSLTV